jgi:hypothetical protein
MLETKRESKRKLGRPWAKVLSAELRGHASVKPHYIPGGLQTVTEGDVYTSKAFVLQEAGTGVGVLGPTK